MNDTARPMSRVDTAWLRMDTDVNLMMIVGVWLLQPAVRYQDLCDRVSERLLKYDRFRQKVVQGALGSEWVDDEYFDVQRHVTIEKLQRRRGQSERDALKQRMGELASTPLEGVHCLRGSAGARLPQFPVVRGDRHAAYERRRPPGSRVGALMNPARAPARPLRPSDLS